MTLKSNALDWMTFPVAALVVLAVSAWCPAQTDATPVAAPGDAAQPDAVDSTGTEPEIKPRLELYVPSVKQLIAELDRSHGGVFVAQLGRMMLEMARASAEGVNVDEASAVIDLIRPWPDSAIGLTAFAPDTVGRARWAVRFEWPLQELYERTQTLLTSDAATELLEGVTLKSASEGRFEIALPHSVLGYLLPGGPSSSYLASHADLPLPATLFAGSPETEEGGPSLLVCRLNLSGTEKDSGATFLSSFSAVTDVVFAARVNEGGDWVETAYVHWPPISGMGAKALFGRVKQTFFVPDEAFGAAAFKAIFIPGMLDGIAGFGPQVMMEAPGEMTIVGEAGVGPIASAADSQICFTILPGTGFLPVVDVVAQVKVKHGAQLINALKKAAEDANRIYRDRERREPWHEATVRERTVLWSDGASQYPGAMMPLVMRPVLFATQEIDARQKERDFLVLAWTSTSPEQFVRRWLDLPRKEDRRYLPAAKKTNGQLWVNWKQLYQWAIPYVNVAVGAIAADTVLPRLKEVASDLTDSMITVKTSYTGLRITHQGPLPTGALVVPALVGISLAPDESGGSDLARERLASQRLKVFYHHAKLFKKDVGRWPAELAELDGYVDFAGHPELLELQLSSRKRFSDWVEDIVELDDEERPEDEDDAAYEGAPDIDDKLYRIEWGRDSWRLGLVPNTLEHLEKLYIDEAGELHRVEKVTKSEEVKTPDQGESESG